MAADELPLPVFVSAKQVAGIIGYSRQYFHNLVKAGKGPTPYKIGKRYRFRKQEVIEWLETKRRDCARKI